MCNKTDAQIGKVIREALGEIVDLMVEETHDKLLRLPRYEKVELEDIDAFEIRGFLYKYAIVYISKSAVGPPPIVAVFMDEDVCNTTVKEFNHRFTMR